MSRSRFRRRRRDVADVQLDEILDDAPPQLFPAVFSPLAVGPMRVPNRICETANTIGAGRRKLVPDDAFIEHHLAKARGGVGWIGSEAWVLDAPLPEGAPDELVATGTTSRVAAHRSPEFEPQMRAFVDAVHAEGAVVVAQLAHLGAVYSPSDGPTSGAHDLSARALSHREIEAIIDIFGDAAAAFANGAVDGLEIHAAHEALPGLFLSPAVNDRQDRWGGNTSSRCQFLIEVLKRVRERAGAHVAIGVRLAAYETRRGGYETDEGRRIAEELVDTGSVDFLNIDVGHSWGTSTYVPPSVQDVGQAIDAARALRESVRPVPVLYAGRVLDLTAAERLLNEGVCDLVGMTRATISDPEFPRKARDGRLHEIRGCIGCNRCIDNTVSGSATSLLGISRRAMCSVNPIVGKERWWRETFRPADTRREVAIAGAGPAGLEAARVAALRGHRVTIFESRPWIGGQVELASRAPGREQYAALREFYEHELARLEVDVRTSAPATVDDLAELKAEILICATGSRPVIPTIPGVDHRAFTIFDVLLDPSRFSGRIAIVATENGPPTPAVAELLASAGCQVEIFHSGAGVGSGIGRYTMGPILARLARSGVEDHRYAVATAVGEGTVELCHTLTRESWTADGFDAVVFSYGTVPDKTLVTQLSAYDAPTFVIGSAWVPRGIQEATSHGMTVAIGI